MQVVFSDPAEEDNMRIMRPRAMSMAGAAPSSEDNPDGQIPIVTSADDSHEFSELTAIPPLPIYALMAADADYTGKLLLEFLHLAFTILRVRGIWKTQ